MKGIENDVLFARKDTGAVLIRSFAHKGLRNFYYDNVKKGINPKHADKIGDLLDTLDAAVEIRDMNIPGACLHKLEPKADNIYSVKVSGAWRITFRFEDGDAFIVDYVNYH